MECNICGTPLIFTEYGWVCPVSMYKYKEKGRFWLWKKKIQSEKIESYHFKEGYNVTI